MMKIKINMSFEKSTLFLFKADANKDFEVVTYPGAGHGFWLPGDPGFHEC